MTSGRSGAGSRSAAWDAESRRLTLEFVTHGDDGFAGPWAARAREGDALVFTGPAGAYSPDPGPTGI